MYRVGVDIGGTYTDFVAYDKIDDEIIIGKVPSTPKDQSVGMINGLDSINIPAAEISTLVHGTTVATNAVIEREGARCGLLTTEGFRDILEIGRRNRPNLWGLEGEYEPMIPRNLCFGVEERTMNDGSIRAEVSEEDVKRAGKELLDNDVEAVVVSFLHAYANPENEKQAIDALREFWPNDYLVRSSEVLPEFREFERASTTTLTAYTQPVISSYLDKLEDRLSDQGYEDDIQLMQSNGGLASSSVSKRRSAHTILSGPAAGATAASQIAKLSGYNNVISCDMGGTSFDVSLLPDGDPIMTQSTELDYQTPIRVPMTDITAIGAGGGSIANVDEGGILHTGPESAGANPGPVCYGKGGTEVTITDANLVLQRINPDNPIGDEIDLDISKARDVIEGTLAEPLGLTGERAANAVIDVGVNKMVGKMRELSIDKGYDPREFTLVIFGGAGPLHAGELIANSEFNQAIVPYIPGVLSALGCILADHRHDNVKSINQSVEEMDLDEYKSSFSELERQGRELLSDSSTYDEVRTIFKSDMKYKGQTHTVSVPISPPIHTKEQLRESFLDTYLEIYSEEVDSEIIIENVKVTVVGVSDDINLEGLVEETAGSVEDAVEDSREVFFDESWFECPVYRREQLPLNSTFSGPAIIEQEDTTTVVNPGLECSIDDYGNIILEDEQ